MAVALFVLGHAGSGKTRFSKEFIKSRLNKKEAWCLVDKDTCGEVLSNKLMLSYGMNPNDRDSPEYKEKVRDLEYISALKIAKEQLKLGINVVLPAPWTKELRNGELFDYKKLGFPKNTKIKLVYMDVSLEKIKERIEARSKPRDQWKLKNWDKFSKSLIQPSIVEEKKILTLDSNFNVEDVARNLLT